jgi:hypothetical protein
LVDTLAAVHRPLDDFEVNSYLLVPAPPTTSCPTCQVCHKVGHNALDCYHWYDHAYQGPAGNQMMAYYTTPQVAADSAWYPDSGCTNHLTSDFTNLTFNAEEPIGYDQVYVGNGQGLPVQGRPWGKPSKPLG